MSSEEQQTPGDIEFGPSVRGFHAGQKLLGRYVLKRVLGRGGMGVVWLVYDEALEREVAFKFLPEMVHHDRGALDDLKRETRRSLELTHPNIVRIYDFIHSEGCAGISMEFIDGDTLSNLRAERPQRIFEVSDLIPWLRQLCSALEYAHEVGKLAHRDLKPANLMLSKKGVLKVADFGISRSVSDTMTRVHFHQGASGTLVYMSPQQAFGERPSISDDIYSLGATIFELLTSKPPFYQGEIMSQVREKAAPKMAERRTELNIKGDVIPMEWEDTVAACLAKDPAQRPPSAFDVLVRLGLESPKGKEASVLTTPLVTAPLAAADALPAEKPVPAMATPPTERAAAPLANATTEDVLDAPAPAAPAPPPAPKPKPMDRLLFVALAMIVLAGVALWYSFTHGLRSRDRAQAEVKAAELRAQRERDEQREREGVAAQAAAQAAAQKKAFDTAKLAAETKAAEEARARAEQAQKERQDALVREAAAKEAQRKANLRGTVQVNTFPAGAKVALEGGGSRESPATFGGLKLGTYRFSIAKDGFESTNVVASLVEDPASGEAGTNVLAVALERSTGILRADVLPPNARLVASGAEIGARELSRTMPEFLPTGEYQIVATLAGRKQDWSATTNVLITANELRRVTLALPFGALRIEGQPEGAVIYDATTGQVLGPAPLTLSELPLGNLRFAVRKKGFVSQTNQAAVRVQHTGTAVFKLQPVPGPERGDGWTNTLGMRFVPVGEGRLLVCVHETRVRDYSAFALTTPYNSGTDWGNPGFKQDPTHPAVYVSWQDAEAFCTWLTQKERAEGKLGKHRYRLPTDQEWSTLVGLPDEPGALPVDRDSKITGLYPWGRDWPPPSGAGNYNTSITYDSYDITSPVAAFGRNRLGIYDLGGNVWEWCGDWYDRSQSTKVLRGGSWSTMPPEALQSSYRRFLLPNERGPDIGFRCVLEILP